MTGVRPQLATPSGQARQEHLSGHQSDLCEHCGRVIFFYPKDARPRWFHLEDGGRVCKASAQGRVR